jgi:hypothetical protein
LFGFGKILRHKDHDCLARPDLPVSALLQVKNIDLGLSLIPILGKLLFNDSFPSRRTARKKKK